MTEWRDIPGFEGKYMASSDGEVYSIPRRIKSHGSSTRLLPGRVLKKTKTYNGYYQVSLCKDSKVYRKSVHRIIAETFMPEHSGDQVNHLNGNKEDNRLDNLEWCTSSENIAHSINTGLRPPKPRTSKKVIRNDGEVFDSLNDAAKAISASRGSIWSQINGRRNHVHGYKFAFCEQ